MGKFNDALKCVKRYSELKKEIKVWENKEYTQNDEIILLNTQLGSDNLGDNVIMLHCREVLDELFPNYKFREIASHQVPNKDELEELIGAKAVIVCGTNFLATRMDLKSVWKYTDEMVMIPNMVLLGVGYGGGRVISPFTKLFYKKLLSNSYAHSVRDQRTFDFLKEVGVDNVYNTNCVTMWGLDQKCEMVPRTKGSKVVTTVTGYFKNTEVDNYLFDTLRKNYSEIYFWPQGKEDLEYVKNNINLENVHILDRTMEAYEECLNMEDMDYVGTRLHGGMHALHHGKRTIIIAMDFRASCISKDTNLPVIEASDIFDKLDNRIVSEWETKLTLNNDNVELWKSSLKGKLNL